MYRMMLPDDLLCDLHASPIVSTLYTSYLSTSLSKQLYRLFRSATTSIAGRRPVLIEISAQKIRCDLAFSPHMIHKHRYKYLNLNRDSSIIIL